MPVGAVFLPAATPVDLYQCSRPAHGLFQQVSAKDCSQSDTFLCIPPAGSPSDRPRRIQPFVRGLNTRLAPVGYAFHPGRHFFRA